MAVLTTKDAALYLSTSFLSTPIELGKVLSMSLDLSQESLETTNVASYHRTFVPGIRSATATVSLLYDPTDSNAVNLLKTVTNGTIVTLWFMLSEVIPKYIAAQAIVTSLNIPFAVRQGFLITLSLQLTGSLLENL